MFGEPKTDIDKVRLWKEKVINQLTGGLAGMAKMRKVNVVNGYGKFTGPNTIEVEGEEGKTVVTFDNAIVAAGSRPIKLPFIPHEDPRIWDSTDALELKEVPGKLLIMGGGIIGLEMATVYHSLGSKIDVVEMFDQLIPAADKDMVKVYTKRIKDKFNLMLETKVTAVEAKEDGIYVSMEVRAHQHKLSVTMRFWLRLAVYQTVNCWMLRKRVWKWTSVALSAWISKCALTFRTSSRSVTSWVNQCWHIKACMKAT